jgi:NADH-quinone oxidoreductase subunit M
MPVFSGFFLFFAMASLGLPGLNNFVGEILILIGAFGKWPWVAGVGFAGLVFTVIYLLWMVQRTLFGQTRSEQVKEQILVDMTARELVVLFPLAAAVLFIGLYPGPILSLLQQPLEDLLRLMK